MTQTPVWYCKIGLKDAHRIQFDGLKDGPIRDLVAAKFQDITGMRPDFIFSGWSAQLTENEIAVVENRNYERQDQETTLELTEDEILIDPVKQVISPEQWKASVEQIAKEMGMPERQVNSLAEPVQHYLAQPTEEYLQHGHKPVTTYGVIAEKLTERHRRREYLQKLEDLLMKAYIDRDDFYIRAVKAQTGGGNFLRIRQELAMHEATITEIKSEIEREKRKIAMQNTGASFPCCEGTFDFLTNQWLHHPSCLNAPKARLADVAVDADEDVLQQDRPANFTDELVSLINRHSMENGSNTPDFILGDFLSNVLRDYGTAATARDAWIAPNRTETNFGFYVDGYTLAHDPGNIGGVKITAMDGRSETIKTSQLCAFLERRLPEPD